MRRLLALAGLFAVLPGAVGAQSLSERVTQLFTFGDCGQPLCLSAAAVGEHGSHFIPSVTQGESELLGFLTGAIATSLGSLRFAAATGGIAVRFVDGAPVATSVSSGGIFSERSQTLGAGRLLIGANINSLSMDNIRGVPLDELTFRFAHQNVGGAAMGDPIFENDIIEVRTDLDLDLLVTSVFASYGIHPNIDVGVLVPLVRASVSGRSEAQFMPFARPSPHVFGTPGNTAEFADASTSGSAFGIGDVALRLKANLYQSDVLGAGVTADVRLPTGDSANFLGSGQTSVRVLGILSGTAGNFAPHLNAGVAIRTGDTQSNSIVGALGFDHLIAEGVTLAFDLLADYALEESQLRLPESVVFDVPARRRVNLTNIPDDRDHLIDASVGLKMQLYGDYRLVTNLLAPLSDGGMRPRYLWTVGFERTF